MRQVFEDMAAELDQRRQDVIPLLVVLLSAIGIVGLIWAVAQ